MYMKLMFKTSFKVTFRDATNQAVVQRLVRAVKALKSMFLAEHIKGMSEHPSHYNVQ